MLGGWRGGEREQFDATLLDLARRGRLVVYELFQDDEIIVQVAVGEPLRAHEYARGHWVGPSTGWIALPTGRLCIEGYDTLRLGSEDPTDAGAILELPPGDYALAIHFVDWWTMNDTVQAAYKGPSEFIALTPLGEASPPEITRAYLPYAGR